ncbi:VIT domain-containing protein [Lysobacter sp. LF1]|uniref:VIT domain-containing protein n=1 Tax=Lysobacter stagni TaxID=3045172 RepID=A0ABT6XJ15_9GAMM|nr:VIT domain-containing protein [Lysobacter sp. LF1]MDI9240064.1 VIT domain-containing protein [Lysobacter sp. LF1]
MCAMLALAAFAAGAQTRAPVRVAPPLMSTMGATAEKPIGLRSARIAVHVDGGMARTSVDLVFHNPNDRRLEGELQFPLLPGQQITGFALDIDGVMRPAVPVPKDKGRETFEAIERKRVDPALLEQTAGNQFRLRVYPVPAQGERRVQLVFSEPMQRGTDGWRLRLPLQFAAGLAAVDLRVTGGEPRIDGTFGPVVLRRKGGGFEGQLQRNQFRADSELALQFAVATEARSYTQAFEGEHYFFAEVPLQGTPAPRALPKVIGLLWDSSASGRKRDHAGELAVLERYFQAAADVEVRLIRLRDRAEPVERFVVHGGQWADLRRSLQATVYDGATDPGGWTPQADVGEYLLVSDGLFNYGQRHFPELKPGQRLYALNSVGAASDDARLSALVEAHEGRVIAWKGAADAARAAADLLQDAPHLVAMEGLGATDLVSASRYPQDGLLRIAGRLSEPSATIGLQVFDNGRTRRIDVPVASRGEEGTLAAHLWAEYSIRALQSDRAANRTAIGRIGQRFGIVTPETSLIVLEAIEDYVEHDIVPPAEYRAQFDALKAQRRAQEGVSQQTHLDEIAEQYTQRIEWWSRKWPKNNPPKPEQDRGPATGGAAPIPAPAAMMADAERVRSEEQAAQRASADEATLDRIEVTGARMEAAAAAAEEARVGAEAQTNTIALQPWEPDSPYARRLRQAAPEQVYAQYLDERDSYADSPAFYLDVADILFQKKQPELALRVLSNLAELDLENRHLLRVLGYRLMQADQPSLAVPVLERVLLISEEEPQSFRDLGLAYAADRRQQQAIDALYEVVRRQWDGRFGGVAQIALAELNAIVANAKPALDTGRIDPRLLKNLPVGLRTVLSWDSDNSDMDLWVTDPNGEKCYYSNRSTYQGGRLSEDFTGGYGPEEFVLRDPKPGKYKVQAHYFGDRQQVVTGATTLSLWLSTGFGTPRQKDQRITLRLEGRSDSVLVGEFEVK